jgi:hypothetical protein
MEVVYHESMSHVSMLNLKIEQLKKNIENHKSEKDLILGELETFKSQIGEFIRKFGN